MPTKKLTPLPATAQITITEQAEEAFLRSSQVCKIFNISNSQLKKLRADGIIPAYKLGKTYLYKHEEIIAELKKVTSKK